MKHMGIIFNDSECPRPSLKTVGNKNEVPYNTYLSRVLTDRTTVDN